MTTAIEYTLETYQKPDTGRWYWLIRQPATGKVLETGHNDYPTEDECREQGAPFIGDWFAGYMSDDRPPAKNMDEWSARAMEGQQRMTADENYRKAIGRRIF